MSRSHWSQQESASPRSTRRQPPVFRVLAEGLDRHGAGIAQRPPGIAGTGDTRIDNRGASRFAIHVQGLLPGESADVTIEHTSPHTGAAYGCIRRRHDAAPERVVPACSAYGLCGGCALQHLSYDAQLAWKRRWLSEALEGAGIVPDEPVPACVATPGEGLGYRTRAKLVATRTPVGGVALGAYAPRSHEVVSLHGCKVVRPVLDEVASRVAAEATRLGVSAYDEATRKGSLRYVLLREAVDAGGAQAVQVSLVLAEPVRDEVLAAWVAALLAAHPQVTAVVVHENRELTNTLLPRGAADRVLIGGEPDGAVWDQVGRALLRLSPRSFSQVNRVVAAAIYEEVASWLSPAPGEQLLDLYSGVGGIGLTAALAAPAGSPVESLGIEEGPEAVADANAAAAAHGLGERVRFRCGDVAQVVSELAQAGGEFALVAVNPPRKGCDAGTLAALGRLHPRALAYVSCEPESLVRDLQGLKAQGYRVARVTPYDMHPHTGHIEALALLRRA